MSGYPVNGPSEGITEASMAPYFEKARALMDQFYALGDCTTCCDGDGEFEWDDYTPRIRNTVYQDL